MSGFDLPPIRGFDPGFRAPPMRDLMPRVENGPLEGLGGLEGGGAPPVRESRGDGWDGRAKPFSGVLADSIEHVQGLQDDVRDKVRGLVLGEDVELHDVMIASSKSEVAFNLLVEVRNKLVDAWEKLSRSSM